MDDIITLDQINDLERIPTGILALDDKIKGLPKGKLIRLHGPPSVGKSTLSYIFAKNAINLGMKVLIIDAEASIDREYIRGLGLDLSKLYVPSSPSTTVKKATAAIIKAHKEHGIDIAIIDSITALLPVPESKEIIEGLTKNKETSNAIGAQARQLAYYLRVLLGYAAENNITIISIAQRRKNIDPRGFSVGEYITGGNAYHFYTHLSMELSPVKDLDRKEGDPQIKYIKITIDKNKTGLPYQETMVKLHLGKGIDEVFDVYQFLTGKELVKPSGAWLIVKGTDKKVRKSQLLQYIKEHLAEIKQECYKSLNDPDYEITLDAEEIAKIKTTTTDIDEDLEI